MNLYQKLVEVRKSIPYLKKDKRAFNYNYASGTQVLSEVRAKIDEFGLLLVPKVLKSSYQDLVDEKGKPDRLVILDMSFTWINSEMPEERLEVPWQAMGQNQREKGLGCALTYAERYFLLKFFNIPTDDLDPDAYQNEFGKQEESENPFAKKTPIKQEEAENPFTKKTPVELPQYQRQNQPTVKDNLSHQQLSEDIKAELVRTGFSKESVHAYCTAQKIPVNANDCTPEQLLLIKKHLKSQPNKKITQEKIIETTMDASAYERGAASK